MIQETPTLLPIATWAKILGVNPLHIQQVAVQSQLTSAEQCGTPAMQYAWQATGRIGREDIATAIATAEQLFRDYTKFSPLPDWYVQEYDLHAQLNQPELNPWANWSVGGRPRTVTLQNGYFIGGGQRMQTVIQAGAAVVYTDPNGDGYAELATVGPIATTVTDVNQIAVYMAAADTHLAAGAPAAEIRPITVSISAGMLTITFRRELGVLPDLVTALEPEAVDGTDNASFVSTVDVYQRYTDPSTSVMIGWLPFPSCGWCGDGTCSACGESVDYGCLLQRDERRSIVSFHPGTYDADTLTWTQDAWPEWRAPDFVRAWYRAGWRDESQARPYYDMDPLWARAITYLSVSMLDRPFCGCDSVSEIINRWQTDLALNQSNGAGSTSWQNAEQVLTCPWGTRQGAVWAWNAVQDQAMGTGLRIA